MIRKLICLVVGCFILAAPARAETLGIVMMHGKHGTPAQLQQLAATVADAGFLVERPEMCWSAARIYAPLLMVSGNNDPTQLNAGNIFAHAPFDPRNKHLTVEADHLGTLAASAGAVLSWLKALANPSLDK